MKQMSIRWISRTILRWSTQLCKYICAYFYLHLMHPQLLQQHLWLITEKPSEARDNGYCFFEFIRTHYPDINVYYAISADSQEKCKLDNLGNTIVYDSLEHYAFYLAADFSISSQTVGAHPSIMIPEFYRIISPLRNKKQKTIFLQHGITKDYINRHDWYYSNQMVDLFCVSSCREKVFIEHCYGYPEGYVRELGLCRFDRLNSHRCTQDNSILIMPTWRKWLHHDGGEVASAAERDAFHESEYYNVYLHLLTNPRFSAMLTQYGYKAIFYPHYALQCYIDDFLSASSEQVIIADRKKYDVQELLKSSRLLVTDYSSVFFDFAYMKKPELFFQFDAEQFRNTHYAQGYFDYNDDAFGPICHDEAELLSMIEEYLRSGCTVQQKYIDRANSFFTYMDNHNCERTYEAIQALNSSNR